MRSIVVFVFSAALVSTSACSRLNPKKPTVAVRGVAVGAVSFSGISGTLSVEVTNPNNFGVPLSAVDWQLSLGGARAVTGNVQLSNTIPANGSTTVQVNLQVSAIDAAIVAGKLARGNRSYDVRGVLHFSTPIGRIDVEFSGHGDLRAFGRRSESERAEAGTRPGASTTRDIGKALSLNSTARGSFVN